MSPWINQLSSWIEHRDPLPLPEFDPTIVQWQQLIEQSDEIQQTYSQVLQRLYHDRSDAGPKTENC